VGGARSELHAQCMHAVRWEGLGATGLDRPNYPLGSSAQANRQD